MAILSDFERNLGIHPCVPDCFDVMSFFLSAVRARRNSLLRYRRLCHWAPTGKKSRRRLKKGKPDVRFQLVLECTVAVCMAPVAVVCGSAASREHMVPLMQWAGFEVATVCTESQ